MHAGACYGGEAFVWVLPALLKKYSFGGKLCTRGLKPLFVLGSPAGLFVSLLFAIDEGRHVGVV